MTGTAVELFTIDSSLELFSSGDGLFNFSVFLSFRHELPVLADRYTSALVSRIKLIAITASTCGIQHLDTSVFVIETCNSLMAKAVKLFGY